MFMKIGMGRAWVLWYPTLGFALMILLTWGIEYSGVSQLVFGGEPHVWDWRDATLQTALLVVVWAVVLLVSRRVTAHLLYLKGFLRVCAWCRRVSYQDQWLRLEEYFEKGFHVGTTHGMCPQCVQKMEEANAVFQREQVKAESGHVKSSRDP